MAFSTPASLATGSSSVLEYSELEGFDSASSLSPSLSVAAETAGEEAWRVWLRANPSKVKASLTQPSRTFAQLFQFGRKSNQSPEAAAEEPRLHPSHSPSAEENDDSFEESAGKKRPHSFDSSNALPYSFTSRNREIKRVRLPDPEMDLRPKGGLQLAFTVSDWLRRCSTSPEEKGVDSESELPCSSSAKEFIQIASLDNCAKDFIKILRLPPIQYLLQVSNFVDRHCLASTFVLMKRSQLVFSPENFLVAVLLTCKMDDDLFQMEAPSKAISILLCSLLEWPGTLQAAAAEVVEVKFTRYMYWLIDEVGQRISTQRLLSRLFALESEFVHALDFRCFVSKEQRTEALRLLACQGQVIDRERSTHIFFPGSLSQILARDVDVRMLLDRYMHEQRVFMCFFNPQQQPIPLPPLASR